MPLCSRPCASAYVALYTPPESPQAALPRSDFGPREFAVPQTIKIASWNINSVRARLDIVERFLQEEAPDILCLQETKVVNQPFPEGPFQIGRASGRASVGQYG